MSLTSSKFVSSVASCHVITVIQSLLVLQQVNCDHFHLPSVRKQLQGYFPSILLHCILGPSMKLSLKTVHCIQGNKW